MLMGAIVLPQSSGSIPELGTKDFNKGDDMVTLNFQVPLGEDGLHDMATRTRIERDGIDAKRQPKLFAAYQMLLDALITTRQKLTSLR